MSKRRTYIHEVYTVHRCNDKDYPAEKVTVIKGKARFKKMLKQHFFEEDVFGTGSQPLCFRLLESPNRTWYRVHPIPYYQGTVGFTEMVVSKEL